jgi:hypothetical protein
MLKIVAFVVRALELIEAGVQNVSRQAAHSLVVANLL